MNQLNKSIFFALCFCLGFSSIQAQVVTIPDSIFKAYLVGNASINTNSDTEIQVTEAQAFTGTIYVPSKNISNLTGIEAFTALTHLYCENNQLTTLDISTNIALVKLYCNNNQLTSLDVSMNTALTYLICHYNQLGNLDISANTLLTYLDFQNNQLTSLNTSTNTMLTNLQCSNNQLASLNLSTNTALTYLNFKSNQLTSLNVSANTVLTYINCNFNQLANLDLSTNTALVTLGSRGNQLISLDLSTNTALSVLDCNYNRLTTLDVSANIALTQLMCNSNLLTNLNAKNGNNINITSANFDAKSNPDLHCIQVDDTTYSNITWTNIDAGTVFRTSGTDCSVLNSISNIRGAMPNLNAYPNPTSKNINISLGKTYDNTSITVRNVIGQVVFSNNYNSIQVVDLELDGATGVYFISVRTEEGEATIKVVKE